MKKLHDDVKAKIINFIEDLQKHNISGIYIALMTIDDNGHCNADAITLANHDALDKNEIRSIVHQMVCDEHAMREIEAMDSKSAH